MLSYVITYYQKSIMRLCEFNKPLKNFIYDVTQHHSHAFAQCFVAPIERNLNFSRKSGGSNVNLCGGECKVYSEPKTMHAPTATVIVRTVRLGANVVKNIHTTKNTEKKRRLKNNKKISVTFSSVRHQNCSSRGFRFKCKWNCVSCEKLIFSSCLKQFFLAPCQLTGINYLNIFFFVGVKSSD